MKKREREGGEMDEDGVLFEGKGNIE